MCKLDEYGIPGSDHLVAVKLFGMLACFCLQLPAPLDNRCLCLLACSLLAATRQRAPRGCQGRRLPAGSWEPYPISTCSRGVCWFAAASARTSVATVRITPTAVLHQPDTSLRVAANRL